MIDLMTRIAWDWGERCFGLSHMTNRPVRALRCLEEALELAQALGVSTATVALLVDQVYSRPVGDPVQEAGGTLLTASVLCVTLGQTPEEVYERELRRCLSKSPEYFAERNREKLQQLT